MSEYPQPNPRRTGKLFVQLDVDYWRNPRMLTVGPSAELLYVRGLCFAKETLSDGYLSEGQVRLLADDVNRKWRLHAAKLVETGLWETTEDGWRIVGFLERNRSRAEVEALSEIRAEAGRVGGVRSGESRSNRGESSSNPGEPEPTRKQLASQERDKRTESTARTARQSNPESESYSEAYLGDGSPQEEERDKSVDPLKRRCVTVFALRKVDADDCFRMIDQLRSDGIGDTVIDEALGQCQNAEAKSLNYLDKVARNWFAQRVAGA